MSLSFKLLTLGVAAAGAALLPTLPVLCEDAGGSACKISCVAPFAGDYESTRVVDAVENITKALAQRNYSEMARYMDEGCTTYDESTKKLVNGRDAVIADVKNKIASEESRLNAPILSFTIDRPFAQVNGETACVCFVLVKEIGGARPQKFQAHCTDVFVKRGDDWKKLNFRSEGWKRVK